MEYSDEDEYIVIDPNIEQKVNANPIPIPNTQYTPEQNLVINADLNETQQILACAGSGKTTTLIARVNHLIKNNIPPNHILTTTFSKNATNELKKRINNPNIKIYTIDAFALYILTKYFNQSPNNRSLSEYSLDLSKLLNETTELTTQISNLFSHVFIDEFQDVSQSQYMIFKNLKRLNQNLIISTIGDDDQNIYEFRDTSNTYIHQFRQDYLPKIYNLSINFRCQPNIVKIANLSIQNNLNRYHKPNMVSYLNEYPTKPTVSFNYNRAQETKELLDHIKHYTTHVPLHKIAILAPKKTSLVAQKEDQNSTITKALAESNIKFIVVNMHKADEKTFNQEYLDKIWISTIHQAKGLEWDVVFILGMNDAAFPHFKDLKNIQESRRLFYVATTRAKFNLHFYYTLNFNNKVKEENVTRFIAESNLDNYILKTNQNVITRSKKSNKDNLNQELNGVTQIIQYILPEEIDIMRQENIIPELKWEETNIYDSNYNFPTHFKNNNEFAIYGTFLDLYVSREITRIHNPPQYIYNYTISKLLTNLNKTKPAEYLAATYHLPIETVKEIKATEPRYFLPQYLIDSIESSYNLYKSTNRRTYDILSNLMIIAISENYYRTKIDYYYYLHYDKIPTTVLISEDLRLDIRKYIMRLSNNVTIKDNYKYKTITGENDAEIEKTIMLDFKTSSSNRSPSFEWILQLLAYTAFSSSNIKKIQIMNLLTGVLYTADLPHNQKDYAVPLLEALVRVQSRLMKI